MSFDLSWLWNTLNSIGQTILSWFQGIWDAVESIVNVGQGIFAGLVAFGSQIWDAITKGVSVIGEWIYNAFKWIYDGLAYWASKFGEWIYNALSWIGSGIAWIAQQIYNLGAWIYNSLVYVWNWVVNTIIGIWNNITSWFSGIANAISSWWSSIINGINTWFTNLLKTFRQKFVATITADIAIAGAWKSAERLLHASNVKDIGYGLLGILASPLVGAMVGSIVDAVTPKPSSSPYPLIPDITGLAYTPPTLEVTPPIEPTMPSVGEPAKPPTAGYGLPYDVALPRLKPPRLEYTTATTDGNLGMAVTAPTIHYTTATTDRTLTMPAITYQSQVS